MTILLQHAQKQYVNKDCPKGFCSDKKSATEFESAFSAMKYLSSQNEESIAEYKFIENNNTRKARHNVRSKTNFNRCRWRSI
jgi:hypothetical protein